MVVICVGFILADAGYDVWMGNARGNIYSRSHVSLSPRHSKFWNFSWDEMGLYDLPAALELSLEVTGQKQLYYIGHSMGTTMFFVLASSRPKYTAVKVKAMFALAPVAFLEHAKSPIRILAPFSHDIELIAHFLGADEFLPRNTFLNFLSKFGCELTTTERKICENFIFLLCGFDAAEFNISMLPVILGHTPAGTSTRTLVHYAQLIRSGRFEPYDFGPRMNVKCYNQSTPPEYDLTNITVPIALHYSDNDWLADRLDVKNLSVRLQQKIGMFRVSLPSFNHVDFMWAKDAPKLVYSKILKALKQDVNK
uniref:AB hydrolase-1 domain-containing protein n=1 Tax=Timema monikensis TaxID=170555 RepID=A0A7R9E907_9NEOP|nr:unnamed protein product [Timema monikensis]